MLTSGTDLDALLGRVIAAITTSAPELWRLGDPEFTYTVGLWSVSCDVRSNKARGRGARGRYLAWGDGDTPELAVANLIERLPSVVHAIA